MGDTSRQEILRRALEFVTLRELSLRLKVPPSEVEAWMNGHAPMPDRKLVMLAGILAEISRS